MSQPKAIVARHETTHGTVRSYVTGFILSLILTLAAYLVVVHELFSEWTLIAALATLAVTQLIVQLVYFLHLGRESRPHWNLTVMSFALMVVVIVVFGSLWIMQNIQYNHVHGGTAPADTEEFIIRDEGYEP
jgi:cytochrome o ubiquinol oxidase operon protein cyoD